MAATPRKRNLKAREGARAAKPRPAKPKNLGARGKTAGANRIKSAGSIKGNTSTATKRKNYQDPDKGELNKKARAKSVKRKLKAKNKANVAATKTRAKVKAAAKTATKKAIGKAGVAGVALSIAEKRKKAEKAALRKQMESATGKRLST
jgi:hypothetical protein